MPKKTLAFRAKLGKKEGRAPVLRDFEEGRADPALSPHATKKSRHVTGKLVTPERRTSVAAAPGEGRRKAAEPFPGEPREGAPLRGVRQATRLRREIAAGHREAPGYARLDRTERLSPAGKRRGQR